MKRRFSPLQISCFALILCLLVSGCQPIAATAAPAVVSETPSAETITSTETTTPTITPTPTQTATPTETATPYAYGPTRFPKDVNPLTGMVVPDPQILERRAVMIKVSNYPRDGRPHAGLSYADLVFDYYIGEGTNRFLALFYGQDAPKVGPVRSARLADAQLVRLYAGILGYAGADPYLVDPIIYDSLKLRAISASSRSCPGLCSDGPQTVFSVFADTAELNRYAQKVLGTGISRLNLEGMAFDSRPPQDGLPADQLTVLFNYYNRGQWRYDPATQTYLRWIEKDDSNAMIPLVDRLNNQQLSFANVVLLFATYHEKAPTLHSVDLWYNQKGKRAVLFRDGKVIEGLWRTINTDRPIQFLTTEGAPLPFRPGNSWIVIVGDNTTLDEKDPGEWEAFFAQP